MRGRLKSKDVRTVYEKKILRLTLDIPFEDVPDERMDGEDMMAWLDKRVGDEIGFELSVRDGEQKGVLMENVEE